MNTPPRSPAPHNEIESDLQSLVVTILPLGLIGLAVLLLIGAGTWRWPWTLNVVAMGLALAQVPVLFALSHSQRLAGWLLVSGLVIVIVGAALWLPAGEGLVFLALPAGLAALLICPAAGAAIAALCTALVLWIGQMLLPLPPGLLAATLGVTWGATGLGSLSSILMTRAAGALWGQYQRMYEELHAARNQRSEFKQVQEDLVHANSELARLSERLTQMYQVADEARRAKEEFVANVSHELRTPLNMIIGFSEAISSAPNAYGVDLPPALLADVDVILRNSRHLAGLVDDVLDLSQVEAGQMSILRERTRLAEIVEEAALAVRPLYAAKGLALTLEIPSDLPLLYCDRTRIRQVILNLLSNAGRFTEQGGVQVRAQREGNQVVVAVADSGPGIPSEQQQRIFEPFHQVDGSMRRRFGGTGLGLSISRRFVEMHGGRMWLESTLGQGSTFCFSLPVQQALQPISAGPARWLSDEYAERQRTRPSRAPRPTVTPRLMVVEPGDVLQHLLSRYLEEFEVIGAPSFDEAVAQLSRSPAQALIINDPAPERMAQTLAQRAAALPFGTPAIVCWVPGEADAAARLGVARYLLKPISQQDMAEALDALGTDVRSVLVVDDQPEMLQLFGRMIAALGRGYRILKAPNGQWALDLLRQRRPDALFLDLVMPEIDGYAVLREKERDPAIRDIPTVAISALDPVRASIMSRSLTLVRSGGLSFRDLLSCIRLGQVTPGGPEPTGPARPQRLPE